MKIIEDINADKATYRKGDNNFFIIAMHLSFNNLVIANKILRKKY